MPLGKSSELSKKGEDLEEAQGLVDAQLSGAEEEEEGEEEAPPPPSTPSPPYHLSHLSLSSSSSSSWSSSSSPSLSSGMVFAPPEEGSAAPGALSDPQGSQSAETSPSGGAVGVLGQPEPPGPSGPGEAGDEEPLVEGSFRMKTAALVMFLLLKYRTKQPTSKAEMLEVFTPEYQDDFPAILTQASIWLRLVFGLDVIEVDPSQHSYILNPILGLTWDGMLSDQWGLPKTGLLGLVLGLILLQDGCVPEEEVWEALGVIGVYDGQEHIVYGEPRDLLTNVWVQEGYLERRQVAGSDPARNEFLWGPRASEETSKLQVMIYMLQVGSNNLGSSLVL
ncbi:melanoma-associated antigen 1-like [Canis lupus baileyi]|nr:melanoma-associated antigen 10-like [Canis lupus familiaris]XP_038442558.1 melanoma-associated antigen 10-like [Canis lupus familiaris]XP_038442560.1 melanoma-associated antigen 10-like [Canis lupus familiaris]XP_048963647.1 melanoma-associated antigen 10-like [Canis lupus dingo]|eukprot:XP_022272022.1 melanoma-associated antigen 10-like [Canis lupus familiaris]